MALISCMWILYLVWWMTPLQVQGLPSTVIDISELKTVSIEDFDKFWKDENNKAGIFHSVWTRISHKSIPLEGACIIEQITAHNHCDKKNPANCYHIGNVKISKNGVCSSNEQYKYYRTESQPHSAKFCKGSTDCKEGYVLALSNNLKKHIVMVTCKGDTILTNNCKPENMSVDVVLKKRTSHDWTAINKDLQALNLIEGEFTHHMTGCQETACWD